MCELGSELEHSVQFKKGRIREKEENWSILDSSERMIINP